MLGLNTRLAEQNAIKSWRTCEDRGREHTLSDPEIVRSDLRPTDDLKYSTTRKCRRCPVVILSVPR